MTILDRICEKLKRRAYKKHEGHLVCWIIYKPEQEGKNVITYLHPEIRDEYLNTAFQGIADHLRANYSEILKAYPKEE